MSDTIERVAKAIQSKCRERGFRECPAPLVHHVAGAAVDAVVEECARNLARWYPDNVSTNAFCAALRSMISPQAPG